MERHRKRVSVLNALEAYRKKNVRSFFFFFTSERSWWAMDRDTSQSKPRIASGSWMRLSRKGWCMTPRLVRQTWRVAGCAGERTSVCERTRASVFVCLRALTCWHVCVCLCVCVRVMVVRRHRAHPVWGAERSLTWPLTHCLRLVKF